jgi:DNA-binding transcriptional regulator YiaG
MDKKQKFIDSFFQRSVKTCAGLLETVKTVHAGNANPTPFPCNLCPKICGNPGALAVHKSLIHPRSTVNPSVQSFFSPKQSTNQSESKSKFPKPFWKELLLIGVAYVAIMNPVCTRFERYIPPPAPVLDGRHKNKGAKTRTRKSFSQKARIVEAFFDSNEVAKSKGEKISQDMFANNFGLTQGVLSKWLSKKEYIFAQASSEKLASLFSKPRNNLMKYKQMEFL